jgi:hypothetical protein
MLTKIPKYMKDTIIAIIASLIDTLGFRGEEFYTTHDDWALSALICRKRVPPYKFHLMDNLAADFKIGENRVAVITKEGLVVDNEETDDIVFLPYDCLSTKVLERVVRFITLTTDTTTPTE